NPDDPSLLVTYRNLHRAQSDGALHLFLAEPVTQRFLFSGILPEKTGGVPLAKNGRFGLYFVPKFTAHEHAIDEDEHVEEFDVVDFFAIWDLDTNTLIKNLGFGNLYGISTI